MRITGKELELRLLIEASGLRSQASRRLLWHSHEGLELIFLLAGATTYELEGRRKLALPGGHFLVVPARTRHRGLNNLQMPSESVCLTFNLGRDGKGPVTPFAPTELEWMASCFEKAGAGVYPFGPTLRSVIQHLKRAMAVWNGVAADLAQKASLRTIICACVLEAAREVARQPVERPNQIVVAAEDYLRAHLGEPLRVATLADHLGFSRARVFELFTAGTGLPPHAYLLRLRLEKAAELLVRGRGSITEIAYATGFGSSQHFSRVFRRYHNQTPQAYRESAERGLRKDRGWAS